VEQLEHLGVEVITGKQVTDVQPRYVSMGDERVEALVTLWAAGVQASPLGKLLGVPVNRRGAVIVDEYLNPPGYENIFVCGDLAEVTENGRQIPGVAQPAMQMGDHAAKMIAQDMEGRPRTRFHYFDKGDMATIGRNKAVADVKWPFKAHWGGFPAWATWLVVHLYFLVGFRNRLAVMLEWGWTYFTLSHGAGLVTGSHFLPGWEEPTGAGDGLRAAPLDLTSPSLAPKPGDSVSGPQQHEASSEA
jgi:NADH:ubiquinone reductase (H+-translocating)